MPAHLTSIGNADITRDTRRLGLMGQCRGQPALCRSRVPSGYGNRCAAKVSDVSRSVSWRRHVAEVCVSPADSDDVGGLAGAAGAALAGRFPGFDRLSCVGMGCRRSAPSDQAVDDFDDGDSGDLTMMTGSLEPGTLRSSQPVPAVPAVPCWVWAKGEKVLQGTYLCPPPQSQDMAQDDQRRRFQAAEKLSRLKLCREIAAATLEQRKLLDGLGGRRGMRGIFSCLA